MTDEFDATVGPDDVHELCPDAVFERGETYYTEGRIREQTRVDDTVTATVEGSQLYDLRLSLAEADYDPSCSCPYDGPGHCKHVVAVLLSLAGDLPPDEGDRIDDAFEDLDDEVLRAFVRDELARDSDLLDRFLARFGTEPGKSHDEYSAEVDQLFENHTERYPVVTEAIDFSQFTELGDRYRERENYRQAAAVYRGLIAGIDDNMTLVDAAYDHYASVFQQALDAYVACVSEAALDPTELESHTAFLAERAETGAPGHRDRFRRALSAVESSTTDG